MTKYTVRSKSKQKRKTIKLSNTAKKVINSYKSIKNIKIVKTLYGMKAFNTFAKLSFPNNEDERKKWAEQFSTSKKESAVFFSYKRGNKSGFKIIMGYGDNTSVLGEEH
jgi:nucleoside permease NupC